CVAQIAVTDQRRQRLAIPGVDRQSPEGWAERQRGDASAERLDAAAVSAVARHEAPFESVGSGHRGQSELRLDSRIGDYPSARVASCQLGWTGWNSAWE